MRAALQQLLAFWEGKKKNTLLVFVVCRGFVGAELEQGHDHKDKGTSGTPLSVSSFLFHLSETGERNNSR